MNLYQHAVRTPNPAFQAQFLMMIGKGKGKVHARTGHKGTEGE